MYIVTPENEKCKCTTYLSVPLIYVYLRALWAHILVPGEDLLVLKPSNLLSSMFLHPIVYAQKYLISVLDYLKKLV